MMQYGLALAFMGMDIITGLLQAVKNRDVNSTKFRDGLFKKTGTIAIMVFGWLVDYAQAYVDLGFSVPIALTLCIAVIVMECISILENIGQLNPDLVKIVSPFLEKLNGKDK